LTINKINNIIINANWSAIFDFYNAFVPDGLLVA